jgi:hypothetical protein
MTPFANGASGATARAAINGAISALRRQFFGDGSDGDVTISGAVTLTRDMNYQNLTFAAGASMNLAGFVPRAAGIVDITSIPAAAIFNTPQNGGNASGTTAGAQGAAVSTTSGMLQSGQSSAQSGAVGVPGALSANANAQYLGGIAGRAGLAGGSSTQPVGLLGPALTAASAQPLATLRLHRALLSGINGGQGGGLAQAGNGDGTAGGGAGAQGVGAPGILLPWSNIIKGASAAAGAIQNKGGKGGNGGTPTGGNRGGGAAAGGAGGGPVVIMFETMAGATAVNLIDVTGGDGADGGTGTGTGTGGGGSESGAGGKLYLLDLMAGTTTVVDSGVAPVAGTAASGITPGVGGVAATARINL